MEADGSVEAQAVISAAPGHYMLEGEDPYTEDGVRSWVSRVHPKFAELGVADQLIAEGYDTVGSMALLDEDDLAEHFSMKSGHARVFVAAARAVARSLGTGGLLFLPRLLLHSTPPR